jgi:hypothetical protein
LCAKITSSVDHAWRDYAAQSQRAYCYTHFSQLYRVWLNERRNGASLKTGALPRQSVDEFVASRDYWQDRIDPRSSVLILGDRCSLKIERGELVIWDGGRSGSHRHDRQRRIIVEGAKANPTASMFAEDTFRMTGVPLRGRVRRTAYPIHRAVRGARDGRYRHQQSTSEGQGSQSSA